MSRDRIQKLLRKTGMLLQDEELSNLERDLAKKYLIEIYDLIEDQDDSTTKEKLEVDVHVKRTEPRSKSPVSHAPNFEHRVTPELIKRQEDLQEKKADRIEVKPAESIDPIAPLTQQSNVEPKMPEIEVPLMSKSIPLDSPSSNKTSAVPPDFKREFSEVVARTSIVPDKHKILFLRESQNELSEKLSLSPIADLRRALGINDKLLIVNQLFDGQSDSYQETIDVLNSKYSFSDARSYLVRYIIDKFGWLDEEKIEPARDFIKLVERRFLESND